MTDCSPSIRKMRLLFTSVVPVVVLVLLVLSVLGSIFFGVAALTEAAAVDAFVAMLPALARRGLTWPSLKEIIIGTAKVTGNHLYAFNIKS